MLARRAAAVTAVVAMFVPLVSGTSSAVGRAPRVLQSAQIDRQDIASQPASEPDTLVEPHVAVSPLQPHTAVAVAHDSRFPDGGAVDISYAWTRNGGGSWHHAPVPGLTLAVGGTYERATDPVVAFAADGTAFLSTLLFDIDTCRSAVAVSRSADGGASWGPPVLAHSSSDCNYSDDKNWLVIDNSWTSPHFGRIYQFWTAFISLDNGNTFTSPQVLRFSDDRGNTWSKTFMINPVNANTQDSQPMIMANGTIVDNYENNGPSHIIGDSPRNQRSRRRTASALPTGTALDTRTSTDGGMSWGSEVQITPDGVIDQLPDVRCCLPAANIDHTTGKMYAVWVAAGPEDTDPVQMSSSGDGTTWSTPQAISQGDIPGVQEVNVTVAADRGQVFVTYGTRTAATNKGGFVQQKLSYSTNGGTTFAAPIALGPVSALQWAAQSRGFFPGDYIGAAASGDFLYLVWCVSSPPPASSPYHQVLWGSVLRY